MELCMILLSTVDKLTALTKWPALPFICNFSENECNKFNCWDFKLSNDENTVHVAAILRKLQQQEKVSEHLCTPPKRDLLPRWQQVCSGGATGGGEVWGGGQVWRDFPLKRSKKNWKCFQKRTTFQCFRPPDGCSNAYERNCIVVSIVKSVMKWNINCCAWQSSPWSGAQWMWHNKLRPEQLGILYLHTKCEVRPVKDVVLVTAKRRWLRLKLKFWPIKLKGKVVINL